MEFSRRWESPPPSPSRTFLNEFAHDVHEGLGAAQKTIPPKYLYDDVGSALFEAITLLPEYGLTRAEERLIESSIDEIVEQLGPLEVVAELGSGNGRKTRRILEAIAARQKKVTYMAVDVSPSALEKCRNELNKISGVTVHSMAATYLEGLKQVRDSKPTAGRLLVLFLGSSIGNFCDDETISFLKRARQYLVSGDKLLLGTDLVKTPSALINAYDDPAGVTAAFNLNLLSRINRELGADFQLRSFSHEARWRPIMNRVEMHLVSQDRQVVTIPEAHCRALFEPGESIWTETSQKFTMLSLRRIALQSGFTPQGQWVDDQWAFAESLWSAD